MDKVKTLTPGEREIAYLFNPDLTERCPHFPSGSSGLRPCKLTGKDCHFSIQAEYENCPIWVAYEKGRNDEREAILEQLPDSVRDGL